MAVSDDKSKLIGIYNYKFNPIFKSESNEQLEESSDYFQNII
jgi:hypothetical protein